jgi:release factor glutamine methyltransferase
MTTAGALVRAGARRLEAAGTPPDQARIDAAVLLRGLCDWSLADWLLTQHQAIGPERHAHFDALIARRCTGEPVAYLLGTREFYGRAFHVAPGVLIPRPETEGLVEEALAWLETHEAPRVVDVGTGSGCIAITLALECARAVVAATDISTEALAIAQDNAHRHGARVTVHHADLLTTIDGPLDLIVSNPPYVPERDRETLMRDVREFEPEGALFGGDDGLDVIRRLIPSAWARLAPGGRLMLEVGATQRDAITSLLETAGFGAVSWRQDLQGIDRVVSAARTL